MTTFDELWDEQVNAGPVSLELRPIVKRWFLAGQAQANKDHYHGQVEDLLRDNEQLAVALERMRDDLSSVCPENWLEDPDWVQLVEAHGLKTPNVESEGAARLLAQLPSTDGLGVSVPPALTFGETI